MAFQKLKCCSSTWASLNILLYLEEFLTAASKEKNNLVSAVSIIMVNWSPGAGAPFGDKSLKKQNYEQQKPSFLSIRLTLFSSVMKIPSKPQQRSFSGSQMAFISPRERWQRSREIMLTFGKSIAGRAARADCSEGPPSATALVMLDLTCSSKSLSNASSAPWNEFWFRRPFRRVQAISMMCLTA